MRLILLAFTFSGFLLSCNGGQQRPGPSLNDQVISKTDTASKEKFALLEFMIEDKACSAFISDKYKNYSDKKEFPLSLFITVHTLDKDKNGQPTPSENKIFTTLEEDVISSVRGSGPACYVGHTTMSGYRDIIFYIRKQDQKKVNEQLAGIKAKYEDRIKSYVFEMDPEWEAVAEFYKAMAGLH